MDTARRYSLTVADILIWISFLVLRSSSHRWTSAKPCGEADIDPREDDIRFLQFPYTFFRLQVLYQLARPPSEFFVPQLGTANNSNSFGHQ